MNRFIITIIFVFFSFVNLFSCTYTITMYDSFGDGWNGASYEIFVNGVSNSTTYTMTTGSVANGTIDFNEGEDIEIVFNSGSYDDECSWQIFDFDGNMVCSGDGSSYTNPICAWNEAVCPSCTDGIQNGTETDIDCGGTCPICPTLSCSGSFYDTGGPGNDYQNYENNEWLFCSDNGQDLYLKFFSFSTEATYDYLYIYDGSDASAPQVAGSPFDGTSLDGQTIVSNNASNCLYIVFTSDVGVTSSGWEAAYACGSEPTSLPPPAPTEEDCLGAIGLCQDTYYNPSGTYGTGMYGNEINVGPSECLVEELGGNWFTFTPETTGILNFTITPDNITSEDYDWVLFDLTNASCSDLTTGDPYNYMLSANAAGDDGSYPPVNQGPTGISSSNATGTSNCVGPGTGSWNTFNPDVTVQQGNTYVLYIAQFSGAQGYTVDFGASQASLYDNTPPEITSIGTPIGCGATTITFYFSENILCSTVDDLDFYLNGPGGPYTLSNITSSLCSAGADYDNYLTADVSPAITTSGTFTIGLDANTASSITDLCGNVAPSVSFDFDVDNITLTTSFVDVDCAGNSTGSATVNVTSNTSVNYTYNWSDGTIDGPSNSTSSTISNLPIGTYDVTITDDGGCTATEQITVNDHPLPTPAISGTLSICSGLTTTLDAGTGYNLYNWSTTETTQTIDVGTTGTYYVTITDNNGCTGTDQVNVSVSSNLNPIITGNLSICSGSSTILDAGTGYANYTWSPSGNTQTITASTGGTYAVTVSDASGCTGSTQVDVIENNNPTPTITGTLSFCTGFSTSLDAGAGYTNYIWNTSDITQNLSVTSGGQYTVTVTDNNGCTGTDQVDVTEIANLTPNITGTLSYCEGSSTILDAGNTYTTYLWSTTDNTQIITVTSPGTYIVTVTDASGCTGTDQASVIENPNPTPTISGDLEYCAGYSTTLDAGTGYNTYTWSPSGSTQIINVSSPGTYSVTVVDANGCIGNVSADVTENPSLSPSITGNLNICLGTSTILDAGIGYTGYLWSDNSTSQTINVSDQGQYSVTVSDANGCTGTDAVQVNTNELVISTTPDELICMGTSTDISVNIYSGGNPPYTYYWNTGDLTQTITVNPSTETTYTVYAVDDLGCVSQTESITISLTTPVEYQVYATKDSVCPGDAVIINGTINNGLAPYTITDDNGNIVVNPITEYVSEQTTYNYTVTDACGLTASDAVTINVYPIPPLSISADILNGCQPLTVNFIETSTTNNGYTYIWNFGDNDDNNLSLSQNTVHVFEQAGIYDISIYVTTDKGCKTYLTIEDLIEVYKKPDAMFGQNTNYVTIIDPSIQFNNLSQWAQSYIWSFGDGDSSNIVNPYHTYNNIQDYVVELIAISEHDCRDTVYSTVTVDDISTLYVPTGFSPDNDGINDFFEIKGHGVDLDNFNLKIYDRWGEIIFETDDFYQNWDGKYRTRDDYVPSDTYYWLITYKTFKGVEYTKSGNISVIR